MRAVQTFATMTMFACAAQHEVPVTDPMLPPDVNVGTRTIDDIRCAGTPDVGPATGWRHTLSDYTATLGAPHHRGIDLIASADDAEQAITGKLTYGVTDKDLEDEDVELFACFDKAWHPIGTARTNDNGTFALTLTGDARLPIGMRDLYVSVAGDRSGAEFIGFVAPTGAKLVVSDVDGTLTASENAYPTSLAIGGDVAAHDDAAGALMSLAVRDHSVVYITARGDRFTQDTRDWFAAKGFPRGPLRMPTAIITMPGEDTIELKTSALDALAAFDIVAGVGNRSTDITAYTNAGVPADRIFIKLSEFEDEVRAQLDAAAATGFTAYEALRTEHFSAM